MNAVGPQTIHAGFPALNTPSTCAVGPRQESACGCAGIYSAPAALPLYAEAFEAAGALHRLEAFASWHGPDFYRLPRNTANTVTLRSSSPPPPPSPSTFPQLSAPLGLWCCAEGVLTAQLSPCRADQGPIHDRWPHEKPVHQGFHVQLI